MEWRPAAQWLCAAGRQLWWTSHVTCHNANCRERVIAVPKAHRRVSWRERGGLLKLAATPLKVVCSISVPEDIELGPESQSGPIHHGTAMGGLRLYPKRNGRKQAWLAAKGGPEEYTVMEERLWTTAESRIPLAAWTYHLGHRGHIEIHDVSITRNTPQRSLAAFNMVETLPGA